MNKFLFLVPLLVVSAVPASARVTPITDWSDPTTDEAVSISDETISCAEKCPGYNITVTYCHSQNEELESCPEKGCGYYHRCISIR